MRIADRPEWKPVHIITDAGSGLRLNPGLHTLLDHARSHQSDLVLVDQLSDLSRSTWVLDRILTVLDECGVALGTMDGAMYTTTHTERLAARPWTPLPEHDRATERDRRAHRGRGATEDR